LVDVSAFDTISILRGCHLYCVKDCRANTYIQNVIKEDALPNYEKSDLCFYLINKKEESSKVSSVVSVNKPDYVEKLPFKPLPPKEVKKKKKKKKRRSKRREETVSSPKHVAPIIVFDESELDDVLMPVTYISDHDWEKHSTFDIENLFGTDSENMRLIIVVPLVLSMFLPMMIYLHMNTLWKIVILLLIMITMMSIIFSVHLPLRRKQGMITICLLFLMIMVMRIAIFGEFAPPTIVHVGSINSFIHVAHDKYVLCDIDIVNSIHDATESYYERGKHGLIDLNNIKFPLFMLQILKLYLFCLPMLVTMCLVALFSYKIPMYRKWFRFKKIHICFLMLSLASSSFMALHEHLFKLLRLAQRR
jgi:hypothetical protein